MLLGNPCVYLEVNSGSGYQKEGKNETKLQ
jgi:hypothetical protein